jgi:hypothetical protein
MTRDQEIAWAAGLFEGEGSIFAGRQSDCRGGISWRASLGMTDKDAVSRFHDAVGGVGHINERQPAQRDAVRPRKYEWMWNVARQEDLIAFLCLIEPYLCERRRSRAHECILDLTRHAEAFAAILEEQKR